MPHVTREVVVPTGPESARAPRLIGDAIEKALMHWAALHPGHPTFIVVPPSSVHPDIAVDRVAVIIATDEPHLALAKYTRHKPTSANGHPVRERATGPSRRVDPWDDSHLSPRGD